MSLFKKQYDEDDIKYTDFLTDGHAEIDSKTGERKNLPVFDNGRIVWVKSRKVAKMQQEFCARCGGYIPGIDLVRFHSDIHDRHGLDALLPICLCYDCGMELFDRTGPLPY